MTETVRAHISRPKVGTSVMLTVVVMSEKFAVNVPGPVKAGEAIVANVIAVEGANPAQHGPTGIVNALICGIAAQDELVQRA